MAMFYHSPIIEDWIRAEGKPEEISTSTSEMTVLVQSTNSEFRIRFFYIGIKMATMGLLLLFGWCFA